MRASTFFGLYYIRLVEKFVAQAVIVRPKWLKNTLYILPNKYSEKFSFSPLCLKLIQLPLRPPLDPPWVHQLEELLPGESLQQDPLHLLPNLIVENSSGRCLCLLLKLSSEEARYEVPVEKISQLRDLVKSSSTGRNDDAGVSRRLVQIRREHLVFVFCNCVPLGVDVLLHLCLPVPIWVWLQLRSLRRGLVATHQSWPSTGHQPRKPNHIELKKEV